MGITNEIFYHNVVLSKDSKNYTGMISKYGVKILKPVGRNKNKQVLWLCECGKCGKTFIDLPARILNGHKKSCGCLKTTNSNKRNVIIKYSFYDWCIENKYHDWLDLWNYELNSKTPKNVSYKTSNAYWFKCINKNKNHHSEKHNLAHVVERGVSNLQCGQCNSFAQWGLNNISNNFLEQYWDYKLNKINPWTISKASEKKVWIKCQEKEYHNSYLIMCSKFVYGCRCPYCSRKSGKIHPLDSLGSLYSEVIDIWSDKNTKTPYDYAPQTNKKVWFKCRNSKHKDYLQIIYNAVNREFRCPNCIREIKNSMLQIRARDYIHEKYNYTLLHENNCTIYPINPETNYPMPYDNEILELKLIIEVNGEQHYKPNQFIKLEASRYNVSVSEAFRRRLFKDEYKKQYALSNGYHYLEISYTYEKDDLYKKIIDEKINNILFKEIA